MRTFAEQIAGSTRSREQRDELCQALGRGEAVAGRSLDALQAAYRTGVQIAWRRLAEAGRRRGLSPAVMSQLADALFGYIDELVSLSRQGYLEAHSLPADERAERRRLLLRLILRRPHAPRALIERAAGEAGWPIPESVTPVALSPRSQDTPAILDEQVLADLDAAEPCLLLPGPLDRARHRMPAPVLPHARWAAGLTVPLEEAADSLRWARRLLAMVDEGVLAVDGPASAEDHLLDLWLLTDRALVEQIAHRRLAVLTGMSATQRIRIAETLGAWLETRGNAVATARRLRVHPQTVRYRMRQIHEAFGDQLTDPDIRLTLEAVLRADRLLGPRGSRRRT